MLPLFCITVISGLCLGLSAPGIGLWPTAWFALAPLLVTARLERSIAKVALWGFLFGLIYNAIYLQWLLGLAPLDWLGFNVWQSQLMASFALFVGAGHQAILFAIFALIYRLLIKNPLFSRLEQNPNLNGLIQIFFVPLLWFLIINKIGNAHDFSGVPWCMLEYTQYKQIYLIQIADTIGGIGIGFLIVMVNTLISLIAEDAIKNKHELKQKLKHELKNEPKNTLKNLMNSCTRFLLPMAVCISLIVAVLVYGYYPLTANKTVPNEIVSIVQPNVNIDMEKTDKKYSLVQLLGLQFSLSEKCAHGLCIWTESAVPIYLAGNRAAQAIMTDFVKQKKLSLIVGTIDQDILYNLYNAAWGISASGQVSQNIYHKRYLVPFGEYTPLFVRQWPDWILRLTNTPAGGGYSSGTDAALVKIDDKLIAPLICFEVISPELATASVRAGGQLLININDLAWFHQSIIGEQMMAAAVFRAIENRRYLIFAANTGPSAVISPVGSVQAYVGQNISTILTSKINYLQNLSLFTRYFVF